jgi:hypothetical protein
VLQIPRLRIIFLTTVKSVLAHIRGKNVQVYSRYNAHGELFLDLAALHYLEVCFGTSSFHLLERILRYRQLKVFYAEELALFVHPVAAKACLYLIYSKFPFYSCHLPRVGTMICLAHLMSSIVKVRLSSPTVLVLLGISVIQFHFSAVKHSLSTAAPTPLPQPILCLTRAKSNTFSFRPFQPRHFSPL